MGTFTGLFYENIDVAERTRGIRMRVLLVAKPWRGGLAGYVRRALETLFPERICWLPTYPLSAYDQLRYRLNRKAWYLSLVSQINRLRYDVAVFINTLPEFMALEMRSTNVLWITDDPRLPLDRLAPFGRIFISDPGYENEVRGAVGTERFGGVVPFACDPDFHRLEEGSHPERRGLCMIANRDAKRDRYLDWLLASGRPICVYGNYFLRHRLFWRHPVSFRPPVPNDRMGAVYARYQVSLNVHAQVVRGGTNMRTFECAAYGISQVVEYRPGIENLFTPGEEIRVFHDELEMTEQIDRILKDRQEARRLAERARRRALSEHTYEQRVRVLLEGLL